MPLQAQLGVKAELTLVLVCLMSLHTVMFLPQPLAQEEPRPVAGQGMLPY